MRFQEAPIAEQFNPDGDGYDYTTAIDSGGKPDENKHWSSLDPRTGMVLKGRNHPTWDLMVEEETKLGNTVVKADNGRYYSVKMPRFATEAKPILPETGLEDTPLDFAERAKRDYDFAIENNITLGGVDAIKREWGTISGLQKKIPFGGGLFAMAENVELIDTVKRLQGNDYEWRYGQEADRAQFELPQEEYEKVFGDKDKWIGQFKDQDKKTVANYLKYISSDKTAMNKIVTGVSVLPTWFVEFAATGGLASLGDEVAVKAGEKMLGAYAQTTAGKLAVKAAGWSSGAVARSAGLGHQVLEKMSQRQLDVVLGLKEEEGWEMSALIGWGDVVIEAASESAGEGMTKAGGALLGKLPFGSKVVDGLEKAWIAVTGGTKGEFVRKMASKAGYSNILGEIGEERLGTVLRAITDVDDFGLGKDASMIDRLKAGLLQDYENIGVELGVLSVPMAGQFVVSQIANFGRVKPDFDSTQFDQETNDKVQEIVEPEIEKTAETKAEEVKPQAAEVAEAVTSQETERKQAVLDRIRNTKRTEIERIDQEIVQANVSGDIETQNRLEAERDSLLRQTAEDNVAKVSGKGFVTIRLETPRGDTGAMVFPSPREAGKWQVSIVDNIDNKPVGHGTFNTQEDALRAVSGDKGIEGYSIGKGKEFRFVEGQGKPAAKEGGKETPKSEQPKKPITIATANTTQEINEVVQQVVTQGVDPLISARQIDLNLFRSILHLDGIASKERQSWQQALQSAKDRNIISDALNIAAQVNAGVKTITVEEKAGLVMKIAQLTNQHKQLEDQLNKTEDASVISDIKIKEKLIEDDVDTITAALFSEGSKAGRLLNAQKLTINQNFDLVTLKNKAKKMKGRALTDKENERLEERFRLLEIREKLIEQKEKELSEKKVKQFVREGSIARFSRMKRADIDAELNTLIDQTRLMLEEGCMN